MAAPVVDATSSPGDSCGEMSPGAASHGHPFVISLSRSLRLSVCLPPPLLATLSLSLSPSHSFSLPFSFYPLPLPSPPPPSSRGLVLYTHQTPRPTPTTIARSFRRIAKTHPLSSRFPVTFVAYARTKTLRFPDTRRHLAFPRLPISVSVSLRRAFAYPRALGFPSRTVYTLYLSPTFRCVSNALVPGVSGITTDRCYDD